MPVTVIVTKGRIPVLTLLVSSLAVSSSFAALDCGQLVRKSSPSLPQRHPILKKLQKLFIASARSNCSNSAIRNAGTTESPDLQGRNT
jgi:hypothetical protein